MCTLTGAELFIDNQLFEILNNGGIRLCTEKISLFLVLTVLVSLKFHLSLGYKMLNHSMHGAGRRCSQFHRIECNADA